MRCSQPSSADAKVAPFSQREKEICKSAMRITLSLWERGDGLCQRVRAFIILTVYCLLLTLPAHASYISLNTSLASKYENGAVKVNVLVVNKGDESAYNVQAEVAVGGRVILAEKRAELPVNGSYAVEEKIPLSPPLPGTYPLTLVMHYTDANQYPFSALTCRTFIYEGEATSPLFGQLSPASFTKGGSLHFTLKNSSEREIKVKTYLVAPRELTVEQEGRELSLGPKSEQTASFKIKNFSALPGSTYQVYAVAEFEVNGLHNTSVFPGIVKIVAGRELFGLSYTTLFIILGLLILIFTAAQFLKKK